MRTRSKLLLAALTATIFMSFAVSAAQARRIWLSQTRWQAIWTLLTFEIEGTATIECPVTIEGSFHSASLSKVSGLLVGYVTSAKVKGGLAECLNTGTARVNNETLPWHLRYDSFSGTLPRITLIRVQLIGAGFEVDPAGALPKCMARTTATNPARGNINLVEEAGGNETGRTIEADETSQIPVGGEILCNISGAMSDFKGRGEVFAQNSTTTRILVRLIN